MAEQTKLEQPMIVYKNYEDKARKLMLKQAKDDDKIVMARRLKDGTKHARHIKRLPSGGTVEYHERRADAEKRRARIIPFLRKKPGQTRVMLMNHFMIGSSAVNADISYLLRKGLIEIERGRGPGLYSKYYAVSQEAAK